MILSDYVSGCKKRSWSSAGNGDPPPRKGSYQIVFGIKKARFWFFYHMIFKMKLLIFLSCTDFVQKKV
jgi:hypothetical protein